MKPTYLRPFILLLAAAFILLGGRMNAYAADELLANPAFAAVEGGLPQSWSKDGYKLDESVTAWSLQQGTGSEPASYVRVQNLQPNDARWLQRVTVKPDTLYRISASVRASGAEAGKTGANLSVLGPMETSLSLYDTGGLWQPLELYGRTGPSQSSIDVLLRLGGYGSENVGIADFSAASLTELTEAPAGASVISFDPASAPPAQPAAGGDGKHAPGFLLPLAFLGGAAFLYALSIAYRALFSRRSILDSVKWLRMDKGIRSDSGNKALWLLLGGGLLLRLLLSPTMQGHPIDFPDFSIWADRAYSVGLNGFFTEDVFADYPPGYIYVLYVVGMLKHLFGLTGTGAGVILLVKLPAVLADLAAGWLLYGLARERFGQRISLMAAGLYIFNPAVWFDSALWAQADSVMTLLVLLAVRALTRSRHAAGAAWLAAAVLVKPQAVIFLPLLLFALLSSKSAREWLKAAGAGIITALLLLLPYAVGREPLWIVHHYKEMFASYPYATLNAFNIYGLVGLNGIEAAKTWLGLSLSTWGNIGAALALAAMALIYYKKGRSGLYLAAFAGSLLVFLLKTGMHERYLYPALIFGLAAFLVSGSRRLLLLHGTLTLAVLANIAYVLRDSLKENFYIANGNGVMVLVSLIQTAAGLYLLYLIIAIWQGRPLGSLAAAAGGGFALPEPAPAVRSTGSDVSGPRNYEDKHTIPWRKEWWPVLAMVIVYAVMMFWQLGDAKAPKTAWQAPGEAVAEVQGGPRAVDHLLLYAGIGSGSIQVSVSPDGVSWSPPVEQKLDGGTVFQWKSVPLTGQTAQAVRISGDGNATVYEAGLFAADGSEVELTAEPGSKLFDEQGLVPNKPSYRNSMYFDEIYHARTAFEHLHRIEPYETTHPPLGKVIISAGIAMFGMNPFGWRVMGGIAGLLLIPAMYVFARGLFRSRKGGLLAAALILLDFMPLVQSRIGTVDTYAVLFIIMSYHFMNRFFQRNVPGAALSSLLLPFALSGAFFGLGASVKWVGVYSGAGLAAIFFYSLVRRYAAARKETAGGAVTGRIPQSGKENSAVKRPSAKAAPAGKTKLGEEAPAGTSLPGKAASAGKPVLLSQEKKFTAAMIGAGMLFFVLIPGIIYLLTYIPFMRVPGPGHGVKNVIEFQKFMYDYHSKLIATHPFSSTWWEWPLIRRPIWYYAGSGLAPGQIASIVSLGNPLLWWAGIPCAVAAFIAAWKRKERAMQVVTIGLLSQYLPWVGIPRLTFIYHYYATVPFLLLCIVYVLLQLPRTFGALGAKKVTWTYLGAAAVLMAMFYPVLTGQSISREYAVHFLKWFSSWTFF